jgi:thiamine transport system substrate-binding protein
MNEEQKIYAWIIVVLITLGGIVAVYEYHIDQNEGEGGNTDLVIYAYDSFTSYGLYNATIETFRELYGINVTVYSFGDAGSVLNRAITEKDHPVADIVVGVDNSLIAKALEQNIFDPFTPDNLEVVPDHLIFDSTHHVIPFDYGNIAIVYDKQYFQDHNLTVPTSFEDLIRPEYEDMVIVEDPRTSSTGVAFLLWTVSVFDDTGNYTYKDYWDDLDRSIYHTTSGWDTAYEMYLEGEAPMVVSYATDPAYTIHWWEDNSSGAIIMEEGGFAQIEGMGIVRNAPHRKNAELYMEYVLSEEFQREIPLNNWMYPVNKNVELPEVYEHAITTDSNLSIPTQDLTANYDDWIDGWIEIMGTR